jgi:hypothetical protein
MKLSERLNEMQFSSLMFALKRAAEQWLRQQHMELVKVTAEETDLGGIEIYEAEDA